MSSLASMALDLTASRVSMVHCLCMENDSRTEFDADAVRGVIFDMDGTLTVPAIDFGEMRERLGISEGDILAAIRCWPAPRQAAGFAVIEEIEERARHSMEIRPGVEELLAWLEARGIRSALMTRNTQRTADHLMQRLGRRFDPVLTRAFEPVKPDPAPVRHICEQWRINPAQVLVVGDYRDDIACGRDAGARTCLLRTPTNASAGALADLVVDDLGQLLCRLAGGGSAGRD